MPLPQQAANAITSLGDLSRMTGSMLNNARTLKEQRRMTHDALSRLRAISSRVLNTYSNSRDSLNQVLSDIQQLATSAKGRQEQSLREIASELQQALSDPTTEVAVRDLANGVNELIRQMEIASGPSGPSGNGPSPPPPGSSGPTPPPSSSLSTGSSTIRMSQQGVGTGFIPNVGGKRRNKLTKRGGYTWRTQKTATRKSGRTKTRIGTRTRNTKSR